MLEFVINHPNIYKVLRDNLKHTQNVERYVLCEKNKELVATSNQSFNFVRIHLQLDSQIVLVVIEAFMHNFKIY